MSISSKIIVILGPTASGKSDLAVKLAKKINGEIISADSRQVYKGLDIGSGKITKKEMCGIPHHLLDVANPKRTFTVSQYQKLAKKALANIIKRGKILIICGGTGLYIDALIYDYQFPQVPPQPKLRKQLEKKSTEELFEQLKKLDPRRAANIDKNNRRRLIRALEIVITTKKPVGVLRQAQDKKSSYDFLKIGIKKSPEELKRLIKKRLIKRLNGIIKEVKNLRHGLSWQRLDDLGLEYRYVSRFLRQRAQTYADLTLTNAEKKQIAKKIKNGMIENLEKEIYRYAKRQITWFSARGGSASGGKKDEEIHWIDNYDEALKLTREFLK